MTSIQAQVGPCLFPHTELSWEAGTTTVISGVKSLAHDRPSKSTSSEPTPPPDPCIPLWVSLLEPGSLVKCVSLSPPACGAPWGSTVSPAQVCKLNEHTEQRLNERTLTSLQAPTRLNLNSWDTISLDFKPGERQSCPFPREEIQAACWEGWGGGGGQRGAEGEKGAGLLWTWLRDYGLPSVGRRPQQLPRGCPKPRRAASSQAWPAANTSSFRSQTTRLPAPVGLSRDSAGGNRIHLREPEACEEGSSCISPGGVVNKTPDPHPHPGRDASQPPAQSLLAHASILSPLPVSSCVCVFLPLSI